jgi:hypothetical protein
MEWCMSNRADDESRNVDVEILEDVCDAGKEDYYWLAVNRHLAIAVDQIQAELQRLQREYNMAQYGCEVEISLIETPPDTNRLDLRHARDELEAAAEYLSMN